MTNTNKMTNAKALAYVMENCAIPDDVMTKLVSMKSQLDKKSGAERKPTATQIANEGIKDAILAVLSDTGITVTELQKSSDALAEYSNQRLSALLRQMVEAGKAVRCEIKGKAYFSKA